MTCLVTTLKEAVTDTELPKIDELVISVHDAAGECFEIASSTGPIAITCDGGTFKIGSTGNPVTLLTLTANPEVSVYPLTPNSRIRIRGINNITSLRFENSMGKSVFTIDNQEQFSRLISMTQIYDVAADPAAAVYDSDLSWLINPRIAVININGRVRGDFSKLSSQTCQQIYIGSGNLPEPLKKISGEISFSRFPELNRLMLKHCAGPISINLSSFPNLYFVSMMDTLHVAKWTAGASEDSPIMAMEAVDLGADLTNMLIDQAKRSLSPFATFEWQKLISVRGNYDGTSASTAIATLKSKGVRVVLNGVEY